MGGRSGRGGVEQQPQIVSGYGEDLTVELSDDRMNGSFRDAPLDLDLALSPQDIAAVALQALTEPGHEGTGYTLTGPRSLTVRRQAEMIGEAIDRPVRVELQNLDDYPRSLSRWSPEIVEARIAALVDHPAPTTDTIREVTGRPARTFANWGGRSCLGLRRGRR